MVWGRRCILWPPCRFVGRVLRPCFGRVCKNHARAHEAQVCELRRPVAPCGSYEDVSVVWGGLIRERWGGSGRAGWWGGGPPHCHGGARGGRGVGGRSPKPECMGVEVLGLWVRVGVCFAGMRHVIFIPCVLLLVLGVVAYFSSVGALRGSGEDRPIVLCNADEMKTLDVGQMSWQSEIRTAMALWEGLTSYDKDTLKPVPGVAERWDLSADGRTYTFHLRKDAKWSNGDAVVAGDFIFAWKRVFLPSTGGNYVSFFNLIEGGEEYADLVAKGKPADFSKVGVESPDPLTLIVHLKFPRGYFLDLCAFPPLFPLNEKSMRPFLQDASDPSKGYTEKWTRPPSLVTDGAFFLKDWKFKQYMLLEPNENYWDRGNVKCKQLVIKSISDPRAALLAYQSGAVDIFTGVPQQFGQDLLQQVDEGRKDVHYMPVFGTYYYIFNCTRPPLTDKRVRKALSLAVDRKKIADEVVRMRETAVGGDRAAGFDTGVCESEGVGDGCGGGEAVVGGGGISGGEGDEVD